MKDLCEKFRYVFSAFGSKVQNTTMKSLLLSLLVYEQKIDRIMMRKVHQFAFFHLRETLLLDTLNFLGGAPSLDSSVRTSRIQS